MNDERGGLGTPARRASGIEKKWQCLSAASACAAACHCRHYRRQLHSRLHYCCRSRRHRHCVRSVCALSFRFALCSRRRRHRCRRLLAAFGSLLSVAWLLLKAGCCLLLIALQRAFLCRSAFVIASRSLSGWATVLLLLLFCWWCLFVFFFCIGV